ncbi:MAG TPA: hypothetical protein VHX86_07600, partial [Tepidisphaeraceae bacterium]|nr:hypothetical protein [Tepidisphaeraceae bacterium]
NDHHGLRVDPLMQVATERDIDPGRPLASPATLCRLENRISPRSCARLPYDGNTSELTTAQVRLSSLYPTSIPIRRFDIASPNSA